MYYSENDVIKAYRNAADKSEIIDILCQLNSCGKQKIVSILIKHNILDIEGNEIKETTSTVNEVKNMTRISWNEENLNKVQSMLNEGLTQKEIAKHFNTSAGNISAVCVKHHIKKQSVDEYSIDKTNVSNSEVVLNECKCNHNESNIDNLENRIKELDEIIDDIDKYSDECSSLLAEFVSNYCNPEYSAFEAGMQIAKIMECINNIQFKCCESKISN